MTRNTLAITCGLPRSGKSTFAEQLTRSGWVRLCPDDYRLGLYGQQYIETADAFIWACVELSARAQLIAGHPVIIDATSATRRSRSQWIKLARQMDVEMVIFWIDTPFTECMRRNHGPGAIPPDRLLHYHETFEQPIYETDVQVIRNPWHATDDA